MPWLLSMISPAAVAALTGLTSRIPPLITVSPAYGLAFFTTILPGPDLINPPSPESTPVKVTVLAGLLTLNSVVASNVAFRSVLVVPPEYNQLPPFQTQLKA